MKLLAKFPRTDQHVAIAGQTGSGKSWGALSMLARRLEIPWLVIDDKRDENIAKLPHTKVKPNMRVIPDERGIYLLQPDFQKSDRPEIEDLLRRIFFRKGERRTNFGVYVDELHIFGYSDMLRTILLGGRAKHMPLMCCSQRATGIDPFVWGQSTFMRAFKLQTVNDTKRFNDNFRNKYFDPPLHHSHYYDGDKQVLLGPAEDFKITLRRFDNALSGSYGRI